MADTALWDFAVSTYGKDGIEPALLGLQDELGLDVCAILYCLWLGTRNCPITPVLDAMVATSDEWQSVAGSLRTARRALKPMAQASAAADIATLRERVKADELEAERLELAALARLPVAAVAAGSPRALAAANLARYFAAMNIAADLLGQPRVLRILDAAFGA